MIIEGHITLVNANGFNQRTAHENKKMCAFTLLFPPSDMKYRSISEQGESGCSQEKWNTNYPTCTKHGGEEEAATIQMGKIK